MLSSKSNVKSKSSRQLFTTGPKTSSSAMEHTIDRRYILAANLDREEVESMLAQTNIRSRVFTKRPNSVVCYERTENKMKERSSEVVGVVSQRRMCLLTFATQSISCEGSTAAEK
jgi:hypothetical protein